ncbi:MAG TPA: universal stress protein [Acidimicrobiia bacterium]|nr:universal stress protein [Acidimicrobiia bacterium]
MNIVVGYVDSPAGEAAIDQAIAESKLRGGKLVVVHSMVGGDHEDTEDYRRSSAAMEAAHEKLHVAGIDHCTHEYVRGQEPAKDLMGAVADHDAGMIIIGIRSRSATGKLILGSNALDILRESNVPVMCVKRKPAESAG